MKIRVVDGDLLEQPVDVIVNSWNRNIIPWWLLVPQGVSGAIKKRGGKAPFRALGRVGAMKLGSAVLTEAGRLSYQGIIHVAGINMLWRGSEYSVRESVRSAMAIVLREGFGSVAFPLIGAGSGGQQEDRVLGWMQAALQEIEGYDGEVILVRFRR